MRPSTVSLRDKRVLRSGSAPLSLALTLCLQLLALGLLGRRQSGGRGVVRQVLEQVGEPALHSLFGANDTPKRHVS